MDMFCYQCQEAAQGTGCTSYGVCGKSPEVAALQDLLLHLLKGISVIGQRARLMDVRDVAADRFVSEALFATITNTDFDPEHLMTLCHDALDVRERLREAAESAGAPLTDLPDAATWLPDCGDRVELVAEGLTAGVLADPDLPEDVRSLRELLIYGIKGMAAYADHALALERENADLLAFMQEALALTTDDSASADTLVAMLMRCGQMGVQAMALLDRANTDAFGQPQPTQVALGVREGPSILVSGHDLRDLSELLEQTAGKGINVYTHGEMLPAHGYPELKKHPHLVGNYGNAWWSQTTEFEAFGGAILMTTNCMVPPRSSYLPRIFTTGAVAWPGAQHIADRQPGQQKDFTPVIEAALALGSPRPLEEGSIPVGFAHDAVLGVADQVVAAVKSGAIKRFVVMAGCDGRHASRNYYRDVAQALPEDSVILTAGCAKYRYNKLNLGEIGGIPRVLDAGQCNDSYSLVVVALKLAEAFGVESVNDLPISYDIAWYEQKAVLVLLALLSLGVKGIRLGPTLPAFVSPGVLDVLVKTFDIKPIGTVEEDVAAIARGE